MPRTASGPNPNPPTKKAASSKPTASKKSTTPAKKKTQAKKNGPSATKKSSSAAKADTVKTTGPRIGQLVKAAIHNNPDKFGTTKKFNGPAVFGKLAVADKTEFVSCDPKHPSWNNVHCQHCNAIVNLATFAKNHVSRLCKLPQNVTLERSMELACQAVERKPRAKKKKTEITEEDSSGESENDEGGEEVVDAGKMTKEMKKKADRAYKSYMREGIGEGFPKDKEDWLSEHWEDIFQS